MTDDTPLVRVGKYGREVYHTDPECHRIADASTRPASDVELADLRECATCAGGYDTGDSGDGDGHYKSLLAAAKERETGR